jgi:hypothetical protein
VAERSHVARDAGAANHGGGAGGLNLPVEQILIKLLGSREVAATDFEVDYGIWHFYIVEPKILQRNVL